MSDGLLERVLLEYRESALASGLGNNQPGNDPELQAVQTAILIEDVFGVVLSDEQIGSAVIGDANALRELLAATMNPTSTNPCAESAG